MVNKTLDIAVQSTEQPTNKVAAAGTAAGAIGAVLVAVTTFVGPAMEEALGGKVGPNVLALITAAVGALVGYFALKYGSQAAAYNVLDKPNVPLQASTPVPTVKVESLQIEENKPVDA
jgi:hypothetical protein